MKWRDILGFSLLIVGVASCMTGLHNYTGGDEWWVGSSLPMIGAGVVVNGLAYRTMRRHS